MLFALFILPIVAKILQNPVYTKVAWPLYHLATTWPQLLPILAPVFYMASYMLYQVSFTSLYTWTMLIVRSWIVHLTPIPRLP